MSKAVSVGETFAIVRPAPTVETTVDAVAAITFAVIDNKVLVLSLALMKHIKMLDLEPSC